LKAYIYETASDFSHDDVRPTEVCSRINQQTKLLPWSLIEDPEFQSWLSKTVLYP